MHLVPRRLLLVGAAPLAIAAVYGGSLALAQSGEPTPSGSGTPTEEAAPETTPETTPNTPEAAPDGAAPGTEKDCDHGSRGSGGSGSDSGETPESDGSADPTQLRARPQRGGATLH